MPAQPHGHRGWSSNPDSSTYELSQFGKWLDLAGHAPHTVLDGHDGVIRGPGPRACLGPQGELPITETCRHSEPSSHFLAEDPEGAGHLFPLLLL